MNATNPFQIPSCLQIDHERRHRERFKRMFITGVVAGVLLLVGLLIKDSISEQAKAAASISVAADLPEPPSNTPVLATDLKPISIPQPAVFQHAPDVPKANISPAGHSETVYVVKSGDTLSRIARTHRTTVKTIVVANSLASDRIAIGTKLKMPEI